MKTIFSTAIVLLASLCFTVGLARSQEAEKTTTFTEINGNVVDSRGKPIEKFTVDIKVFDYSKGGWSVAPEVIGKWNGEFENGEFQFDVADPIKVDDKVYIYRTIKAAGHLELGQNAGYKLLSTFKGDFGKIKLSRAIKITGKIVLPVNQQEEELLEPKIYLAENLSRIAPDYNKTFQRSAKVEKDGSFEVLVPEDRKLNITASCNNAATTEQRFTIKKSESAEDEQDLGEIRLKEGVSVTGIVVNRDGEPVKGQIVKVQQRGGNSTFIQNIVYGYSVSDAEGKFKLPPREGKCTIALVKQAHIDGELVKVKGELLMAKALPMQLKVGKPVEDIEIRESKTWKISGIIKYDKAVGLTTVFRSSASGDQQYEVDLDEDGNFEFQVVDESEPWLSIYGYLDSGIYLASMSGDSLKQFKDRFTGSPEREGTYFQLKKVTADIGPLEFSLNKQLVDDRNWGERLFDWYYFGE